MQEQSKVTWVLLRRSYQGDTRFSLTLTCYLTNALLHSIEGGVLIGIQCKIRSRAFIWSPFDLIERIKIQILCLFHTKKYF